MAQTHHRAKCRQNRSSCCGDIAFFEFSKRPPLGFVKIEKFYWLLGRRGSRRISMPNFVKIGLSVVKILRFFRFFEMAAAIILDCWIQKILLADSGRMAQTHQFTKFRQNWSFHCRDVAIFRIFKMNTAAILDFWDREILLAIGVARVETHQHAKFCQNRWGRSASQSTASNALLFWLDVRSLVNI